MDDLSTRNITNEGISFVAELLIAQPSKRPTAEVLLQHIWLEDVLKAPDSPINTKVDSEPTIEPIAQFTEATVVHRSRSSPYVLGD